VRSLSQKREDGMKETLGGMDKKHRKRPREGKVGLGNDSPHYK